METFRNGITALSVCALFLSASVFADVDQEYITAASEQITYENSTATFYKINCKVSPDGDTAVCRADSVTGDTQKFFCERVGVNYSCTPVPRDGRNSTMSRYE